MPNAMVEVLDELVEDVALAGEVQVEGAGCDARCLHDLDDRRFVITKLGEHLLGGREQPRPVAGATRGASSSLGPATPLGDAVAPGPAVLVDPGVTRRQGLLDRRPGPVAVGHPSCARLRRSRSPRLSTLPDGDRGSSAATRTARGVLNAASRSRQKAINSASSVDRPVRTTATAIPTSPHRSSGMASTAASAMAGCSWSTASTSAG